MNVPEKYKEYDELLKTKLDDYRYIHSLGVARARGTSPSYTAQTPKRLILRGFCTM